MNLIRKKKPLQRNYYVIYDPISGAIKTITLNAPSSLSDVFVSESKIFADITAGKINELDYIINGDGDDRFVSKKSDELLIQVSSNNLVHITKPKPAAELDITYYSTEKKMQFKFGNGIFRQLQTFSKKYKINDLSDKYLIFNLVDHNNPDVIYDNIQVPTQSLIHHDGYIHNIGNVPDDFDLYTAPAFTSYSLNKTTSQLVCHGSYKTIETIIPIAHQQSCHYIYDRVTNTLNKTLSDHTNITSLKFFISESDPDRFHESFVIGNSNIISMPPLLHSQELYHIHQDLVIGEKS